MCIFNLFDRDDLLVI